MEKARILIVEDEGIIARDIGERLETLGYSVSGILSSGEDVLHGAETLRPDLVLMDIVLKGEIDGAEAATQVRARLHIPVVYLTAYADESTLQRAKVTEPFGYILKPFDDRELQIGIEIALYKHRMEKRLQESERWLSTTLTSIGDAVIATERQGLVAFMNPVAEKLTGWKQQEALGRDLKDVFHILNEKTRHPAPSPIERVIREGIVVGLGNHTLLIAKDGREIPIQDSGAPIQDDKGQVVGVVLVFHDDTERRRAEEALARERDLLHTLMDNIPDHIYFKDANSRFTRINKAKARRMGLGHPSEAVGKTDFDFYTTEFSQAAYADEQEILRSGQPLIAKVEQIVKPDGETWWASATKVPIQDKDGRIIGIVGISRDITELKQAEEALRETNQTLQALIAASPLAIVVMDNELRVKLWNPAAERIFGWKEQEILGQQYPLIPEDKREEFRSFYKSVRQGGALSGVETRRRKKDGSLIDVNLSTAPLRDTEGNVGGALAILADITEHKQMENALVESERKLRLIAENMRDAVFAYDMNRRLQYVNPAFETLTGYTTKELYERNFIHYIHPEDEARMMRLWEGLYEGKAFSGEEFQIVTKDGQTKWCSSSWSPLLDEEGRQIGIQGRELDITERKHAEEALRESQAKFQELYDEAPVGYHELDTEGRVTRVNRTELEMLGYTAEEMVGHPVWEFVVEEEASRKALKAKIAGIVPPGRAFERTYRRKDGTTVPVLIEDRLLQAPDGRITGIRSTIQNITERKRAEEAERHSRMLAEATASASLHFLEMGDVGTMAQIIAEQATQLTGAQLGIVIDVDAQSRPRIRAVSTGVWKTLKGEVCERARRELEEKGFFALPFGESLVVTPLREGTSVLTNSPREHPRWAGTMPDWHPPVESFLGVPVKIGSAVVGMIALANRPGGFTERELHDLETFANTAALALRIAYSEEQRARTEEQLHQAMKMEAIGRLAGGIAHDFNNLLTAVTGYAELGFNALHPAERVRRYFDEIRQAADRATKLTRQLLTFSRRQPVQPRVINLNAIILDMHAMLRRLIGEDIELVTLPAENLWSVRVDPGHLEQVLVNLAVNARDAMPHGGRLTLETANIQFEQERTGRLISPIPGEYVMLAVSDTGVGMTDEVKTHLFEPFFTTKEVGKGTGLGLATCYGIVKQSGGWIRAYSEPGQGTTFKIYFPRVQEPPAGLPPRDQVGFLPRGTETILLVEDEVLVRSLATQILRDQGYTVLEATNGEEALQIVQQQEGQPIHLLLTDVVMPQMGGKALADRLRATRPGLKVLFASGYMDEEVWDLGVSDLGIGFLQKPFTPGALARKVREVLDASVEER